MRLSPSLRHVTRPLVRLLLVCAFGIAVVGCGSSDTETVFTFDEGPDGWIAGFADYPVDADLDIYDLEADWRQLPPNLDGKSLYSRGTNRSDDLWMFWKRSIEGLDPNTDYSVAITIELASNVPEGLLGVGGSPGESVYVKAGAATAEPDVEVDDLGWWRFTADQGIQSSGGEDALVVGTMANPELDPETADGMTFELMSLDTEGQTLTATTDASGVLWVFVGTDSGFEGRTDIYYDRIMVSLESAG